MIVVVYVDDGIRSWNLPPPEKQVELDRKFSRTRSCSNIIGYGAMAILWAKFLFCAFDYNILICEARRRMARYDPLYIIHHLVNDVFV